MAGRELILLSCDTENPQDLQIAVSAVCYFVQNHSAAALSCLAKNSIEVLLEARKTVAANSLSTAWNPRNTDALIWEYQVQRAEDAECWSQELGVHLTTQELPDIETEDQYQERIKQAVWSLSQGCHMALVPACVIATVLQVCQVAVELPLTCLVLKLTEEGTESTWFANTYEILSKMLQNPIEKPSSAANIPVFAPLQVEEHLPSADSMLETRLKQVEAMMHQLTTALELKNQEVEVWKETLKQQNARFGALEERMTGLETVVYGLKQDFQAKEQAMGNKPQETRWENWDLQLQQLDMTVQELRGSVDTLHHTVQTQASPVRSEENWSGSDFPVTIESATVRDENWYISVVSARPCWGHLCLAHTDSQVTCPQPYHISSSILQIDLSAIFTLQPGQLYQLYFLNETRKVSNDFSLFVPMKLRFEDTFFYLSCANVTELMEYIRQINGETTLQLFKRLACEWINPKAELLEPFVTIFTEMGGEEEAVRLKMTEAGFQLASNH